MKLLLLIANLFLIPTLSYGTVQENSQSSQAIEEYFSANHQEISKVLYEIAKQNTIRLNEECSDKYNITLDDVYIVEPIIFSKEKLHPVKGMWLYKYKLDRCGVSRIHNVYFISDNGDEPKVFNGIMGNTIASPHLAYDSLTGVYTTVSSKLGKLCQSKEELNDTFVVFDSKVIKSSNGHSSWDELWSIKACKNALNVLVKFTSDGKGGTYYNVPYSEAKIINKP